MREYNRGFMLEPFQKTLKEKCRLSDKQLRMATKIARGAELWCMSGVVWWGAAVLLGLGGLGLHALGVGIPVVAGTGALIFGGAMAAKSVLLQWGFHALHGKGVDEQVKRGLKPAQAPSASPKQEAAPASPLSKIVPACQAFNIKAKERIVEILATLPHPSQKRDKLKAAGPRLRL